MRIRIRRVSWWSPDPTPWRVELVSRVPGDQHRLRVGYYDSWTRALKAGYIALSYSMA